MTMRSPAGRVRMQAAKQLRHLDGGRRRFESLVVAAAAGALLGLLPGVGRQHAERHRHAGAARRVLNAVRHRRRDVFEVRRRAADDAAEADDGVEPPGLGQAIAPPAAARTRPGTLTTSMSLVARAGLVERRVARRREATR